LLRAEIDGLPHVRGLRLLGARGEVLNSTRAWPAPRTSEADEEHFQALESDPDLHVMLSKPWFDGSTGDWMSSMARKVSTNDGDFLGVLVGTIQLSHFEDFFGLISPGESSSIALLRSDGVMLVRHPHRASSIGAVYPRARHAFADPQSTPVQVSSPTDAKERLIAFRRVPHFPLVVTVAVETVSAMRDWRDQTKFVVAAGGVSALLFVGIILLIIRQMSIENALSSRRLALEKQRLDVAVNNMTQGLLVFDAHERLVVRNQRYLDMFGLSPEVVKPGCSFRQLMNYRKELGSFAGDVEEYCANYSRQMKEGKIARLLAVTTDGRSIQIVNQPLADGGWVATLEDITEQKRSEEKIAHLAHFDALTDLPNRVLFRDRLVAMLKQLGDTEMLAVLYLDLDQFKDINDTLGHPAGDELLNIVAGRLRACVKATDVVARLGGDEFAIIQADIRQLSDVTVQLERIVDAIRKPMVIDGHELVVDTSIGIAIAPRDGVTPDQLLKHADLALYQVKADGRGAFRFFEPAMDARAKARRNLEFDLRHAIEQDQLELHYQPLVILQDGKISGFEALVRWRHPTRGLISPIDFIPLAEECGLINRLGEWVLRTACVEATRWPDDIKVGVNVSPVQFRNESLALTVAAALAASHLPAHRLELEITEAVLMRDDEMALRLLGQLQQLGVRIALDDFGTGYSSLSYLQRFPFDKIKIDRCFIDDVAKPHGSLPIVQAIVSIAKARRMTTTAEGVETPEQLNTLRESGCTEMQGYLICRPRPASELGELFSSARHSLFAA
jgi:diguanylate cyclase (GGDEF)-like protein